MQKKRLIPTPLSERSERPGVPIADVQQHSHRRFRRLIFLLTLLYRHVAVRFAPALGRDGGPWDALHNARYIRTFCEEMGGLWVKVGQILAMRRDVFSQTFCEELGRLHDHASGFPGSIAVSIIEREIGPLDQHFSEFGIDPIAAASIAQIHEARLAESGLRVVVKVQRPGVAAAFSRDLRFLKRVVLLIKILHVLRSGRWDEMLWELDKTFTEELDYRLEASSISRMRKLLRHHKVYAPKVFQSLCTRRVLVMEYVEGVFMSEYIKVSRHDPERVAAWNAENGVSAEKLGQRLYLSHLRQVFEDKLYHCDLHPGNVIILRDNRFALIDFGSIASFERSFLEKYLMMFHAIAARDFTKVADLMLLMSPALPDIDLSDLRGELVRAMRSWELKTTIKRAPYYEKSLTSAMASLAEILGRYDVPPAWEFLRLQRAEITLDSALSLLMPTVNYVKLAKIYMEKAQQRDLARISSRKSRRHLFGSLAILAAAPYRLNEIITFQADWLRLRAMRFGGRLTAAADVARLVASFILQLMTLGIGALVVALLYPKFHNRIAFIDKVAGDNLVARLISLKPGEKAVVAIVLMAALVLLFRIRHRLSEPEPSNPGAHPS